MNLIDGRNWSQVGGLLSSEETGELEGDLICLLAYCTKASTFFSIVAQGSQNTDAGCARMFCDQFPE